MQVGDDDELIALALASLAEEDDPMPADPEVVPEPEVQTMAQLAPPAPAAAPAAAPAVAPAAAPPPLAAAAAAEAEAAAAAAAAGQEETAPGSAEGAGSFLSDITLHSLPAQGASQRIDNHKQARDAKRLRTGKEDGAAEDGAGAVRSGPPPFDPNAPYDAKIKDRRSVAEAVWAPDPGVVELVSMRGNFWRVMGFSSNRRNFLQPEEALLLVEKAQLCVYPGPVETSEHIPSSLFYEEILHYVPQACYLTYVKLKSLEYITFRHSSKYPPRAFAGDADIFAHLAANPTAGLLESLIAFNIYPQSGTWSKKLMAQIQPTSYVLVMTGDWTLSARLKLRLLEEARGVPVIFAAVLPSGNLILEEFTDARFSLDWQNVYARPIDMSIDLTKIPTPILSPSAAAGSGAAGAGAGAGASAASSSSSSSTSGPAQRKRKANDSDDEEEEENDDNEEDEQGEEEEEEEEEEEDAEEEDDE